LNVIYLKYSTSVNKEHVKQ